MRILHKVDNSAIRTELRGQLVVPHMAGQVVLHGVGVICRVSQVVEPLARWTSPLSPFPDRQGS